MKHLFSFVNYFLQNFLFAAFRFTYLQNATYKNLHAVINMLHYLYRFTSPA